MKSATPASPSILAQIFQTIHLTMKLLLSSKVPAWTKVVPLLALVYLIFPFDFLPDFFPGLGQLDDVTIVLLLLWAFVKLAPQDVVREMSGDSKVVDADYTVLTDEQLPSPSSDPAMPNDKA